jgi:F0F1-type ATP synthase membrane subunit b/b'
VSRTFREFRTRVATSHDPVDALLVIALDLLSQTEAEHRAARRLEQATQLLADAVRERGRCDEKKAHQVRQHLNAIRDMSDLRRTLLREFDRELHDWLSGIR